MECQQPNSNPSKAQLFDNRYVEECSRTAEQTIDATAESDLVHEFQTGILFGVV